MDRLIADGIKPGKQTGRRQTVWVCILLALVTAAVYWPVVRQGFINFDDPDYVSGNPRVQAGLTMESIKWAFTSLYASNWHPLTWLSHMLDCQLYHLKPAGHHITSLLFHIANTVLLFGLLKRLTGALWRSALVAALFALHPLHVESVAWISERKDVLSSFFFILTLWAYARYAMTIGECQMTKEGRMTNAEGAFAGERATGEGKGNSVEPPAFGIQHPVSSIRPPSSIFHLPSWFYYGSALLLFTLGLMSKPMLVTLPFVLLLLDYWPLGRMQNAGCRMQNEEAGTARRPSVGRLQPSSPFIIQHSSFILLEKLPFLALSAVSCVITFLVQRASGAVTPLENQSLAARLANALLAYVRYLEKTLWPTRLAVFYPGVRFSIESWQVVGAALLLLGVTVGVVLARKREPYLLVGWFWFLGMLVPVIGLVQVGRQSMADRYTYLPHIGLFICLVWGTAAVLGSHWMLDVGCWMLDVARIGRNRTVGARKHPTSNIQHPTSIGAFFVRLDRPLSLASVATALVVATCMIPTCQQLSYWRNTRTLFQHTAAVTSQNYVAYAVIGNELAEQHKLPEAIDQCEKALAISPDYPEAHNTLGNVYAQQGKYDEALAHYRQAAQDRTYADPRNGMASVLNTQGKFAEAEAQSREALRLAPMHLPAMFCLAVALQGQGKRDEAVDCYRRMLALNPSLSTPHRNLGKILLAQGKADEAVAELSLAIKLWPQDADTRTILGVTLLGKNRTEEAVAQFLEAARLQPTNALANYNLALICQGRKQPREAVEYFRLAIKAQPDWPESLNNLAWILAANPDSTLRNGTEAVALAEQACKLTYYKEPLLIGTLAAAYAETGQFTKAVNAAEKARALALAAGLQAIAKRNQDLLALYRAGRPYHESE